MGLAPVVLTEGRPLPEEIEEHETTIELLLH